MAHACRLLSEFLYTLQKHFAVCIPSVRICRPSVSGCSFRYSAVCLFRTDLPPVCFRLLFQVFGSVSLPYRSAARPFQAALSGIRQCVSSVQTCRPSVSGCSFRHSVVYRFCAACRPSAHAALSDTRQCIVSRTDLPSVCFEQLFQAFDRHT